ncbi:MAG: tRNA (adenosine(37)-N6)-dimethylallyltransferase MiaA [Candidatus Aminicenantes bacterium]|nr:MAG: tRNA (adenosine(37)-N6)-dimethylallyltransferase MiaA [Candidatus Aminicenantes bacterium]
MHSKARNLIVILGPTGVGKSATAIKLAKEFGSEIINCDSMQVYKAFDIGTDKIPPDKREGISHHLLDVVDPSTQFTAADFVALAVKAVNEIIKKKKLPLIVGGTGLYLKALIDGLFPGGKSDPKFRLKLEKEAQKKGLESLRAKLTEVDPVYSQKIHSNDKVRIIRALEVYLSTKKAFSEHFFHTKSSVEDFNIIKIGLKLERQELYKRIEQRTDKMFERGLIQEVEDLLQTGIDESSPPFRALGYKHALQYLRKEIPLEEAISLTKRDTRRYAKRQMTWFKKMKGIEWFSPHDYSLIVKTIKESLE